MIKYIKNRKASSKSPELGHKCHWHQHDAQMIWTDEHTLTIPVRYPPSSKWSNLKQFVFQMTFAIYHGDSSTIAKIMTVLQPIIIIIQITPDKLHVFILFD